MYLVGSRGLNLITNYGTIKETTDWDLVLEDGEDIASAPNYDISPADLLSKEICQRYYTGIKYRTPIGLAKLVHPICIMLFKRSHLHRPLNFAKHIKDYHWLKEQYFNDVNDDYFELLNQRTKLTKDKFGDRTPSLKKTKTEFFDDYVKKFTSMIKFIMLRVMVKDHYMKN